MTTVLPYYVPKELYSVVRLGEDDARVFIMVEEDKWLEPATGETVNSHWLYEVANSGTVDETKPFPWVNRVGLTELTDNTELKHEILDLKYQNRILKQKLENLKKTAQKDKVEIERKDEALAGLTRNLEDISKTLFHLSCDANVAISIDNPNAQSNTAGENTPRT